jgi:hypothetical protein
MVQRFDNQNLKEIRIAINNAMKAINDQYGLNVSIGTIRFTESKFTTKMTATTAAIRTAPIIHTSVTPGVKIDLGTTFMFRGTRFTITKIYSNRPKYKYIAVNARGTTYKWAEEQVRAGM